MFSRIFDSAKRILSRSPSAQRASTEPRDTPPRSREIDAGVDAAMVTTRRGTETPGTDATPRSSVRKGRGKREWDTESTPTAAKRQRKSAGNKKAAPEEVADTDESAKDAEASLSGSIEVGVPPRQSPTKDVDLPTRRRESPKVVVAHESSPSADPEPVFHTPLEQVAGSVYATPATRQPLDGSPTPKEIALRSRTPASTRKSGKRDTQSQKEEPLVRDEIPSSTQETELSSTSQQNVTEDADSTPVQAEKAHVRFGSEEPVEAQAPEVPNIGVAVEENQDEDDASDSDEAPEMVTTASAKTKAKAAEAEASRAQEAQREKEKMKREERERKKAEEQAQKRKREDKKAKKLAKQSAKEEIGAEESMDVDIHNLPALLPDSILEAAGDHRPPTPPHVRPGKSAEELRKEKLNRHIKFLERSEKPIKDIKKGSLSVSVLARQNKYLAPKVNKDTQNIREHWLKGRQSEKKNKNGKPRMQFKKVERKSTGGGFLKNEN